MMTPFIIGNHNVAEPPDQADYRLHAHDYYEILLFLSGDADYSVEGYRYSLQRGDLMLMCRSEAHHLVLKSDARYERICVHFDAGCLQEVDPAQKLLTVFHDRPMGRFNQYRASRFPDRNWRYYMEKISSCQDVSRKLCYLLPLLDELGECFSQMKQEGEEPVIDRAAEVMTYINRHLEDPLSLQQLSQRFHYSKTHLNELFKQSAGTTVWQYIVTKRLLVAREQLRAGVHPTSVYQACGFQDYSTFYRAYRQHLGISPREDAEQSR